MTDERRIITGIDIGTTKIAVVIAECCQNEKIKILGVGKSPSNGLKKGVVVNINDTVDALSCAISEAEKQADYNVKEALVGITGDHIRGINYSGVITINKNNKIVSGINSFLIQTSDSQIFEKNNFKIVSKIKPSRNLMEQLIFAFNVCFFGAIPDIQ